MTRILGSVAALTLTAQALSGCTSSIRMVQEWECETPAQPYALKAANLVPQFRGSGANISQLAAAAAGRYQLLVATIDGATARGEHADSQPELASWVAYDDTIAEVTAAWDGALPDGATISDWPEVREAALGCLPGGNSTTPTASAEPTPSEDAKFDPTCREVDAENLRRATDLVTVYWGGKVTKSAMVAAGSGHIVIAVKISGATKDDYGTSPHSERDRATFVSRARKDGSMWFAEIADGWTDLPTSQPARVAALDCLSS